MNATCRAKLMTEWLAEWAGQGLRSIYRLFGSALSRGRWIRGRFLFGETPFASVVCVILRS